VLTILEQFGNLGYHLTSAGQETIFMRNWQLQEAKAKFSEVIELAAAGEAQVITKRGQQTAVIVSHAEYVRLQQKSKSALEATVE
jgi:prevent-host-death family protein